MRKFLILALVVGLYGISRVVHLTILPVFADEAIYIRWAQLMNHDFDRYAFFPMQDGKPPLYMWLLRLLLPLIPEDPLVVSRLMSGGMGLIHMGLVGYLTYLLSGSKRTMGYAVGLYIILPFTFFFDRMGLIDPLVALCSTMMLVGLVLLVRQKWPGFWLWGIGLGLGLMTKPTMIIFGISCGWLLLYLWVTKKLTTRALVPLWGASALGVGMFWCLRISPSFGALFTRSGDFSFSISEIAHGQVAHIPSNWWAIFRWLGAYLTWPGWGMVMGGVILSFKSDLINKQKLFPAWTLVTAGGMFVSAYAFMGQVITARYLLPVVSYFLPVMAMGLEKLREKNQVASRLVMGGILIGGLGFIIPLVINPGKAPFPHEEKVQYLTEWAAGYGIPEVRDMIRERARTSRLVVATEGYYGTLPDGLLMYFDQSPLIANLEIYGIGQPLNQIPDELLVKAQTSEVYVVVNSHRFLIAPVPGYLTLKASYPRPYGGPDLLLFQVSADEP